MEDAAEDAVLLAPIQTYRVRLGLQLSLRKEPDHESATTGAMLTQGSLFEVDMTQIVRRARGDGGDQTFLRAINLDPYMDRAGRASTAGGWVFQYHPTSGKDVCELAWNTSTNMLDYAELQAATANFDVQHQIGAGACCTVYQAEVRGIRCALKVFSADAGSWEAKQFNAEMELLRRVQHPNICRLYASSTNGEQKCLVLELLDCPLDTRLEVGPVLCWEQRVWIALCICRGIAHLHSLSPPMIHRWD
jgi:hypothetical protein